MIRAVLWLCNRPIEEAADRRDGTGFRAMARALAESGKIRLAVVGQAKVRRAVRRDTGDIAQWVVPYEPLGRNGLPSSWTVDAVQRASDEIKPDLIHVWGTENYWGLLTARAALAGPAVLEIQGIKYVCASVFYGGLSLAERIRCIGPVDILRPRGSFFLGKRRFERWGKFEREMILKHKFISTQSDWVRAHVLTVKPECVLFKTGRMLRREFFECRPWSPRKSNDSAGPYVFTSSAWAMAYKGLHVLIRAIAILKRKYPRIILNVAGDIMKRGITRSGYSHWLQRESRRLSVSENIRWLGPLDADGIIRQFHQASVVVIPSFVESYSLVMAEAMLVGVPVVATYVGAMPELARDEESALFFPPGDESACAWQLDRILSDPALAGRLSENARQTGLARNDPRIVMERQIGIYNEILRRENEGR
jgi:glycosyltransferase involved in cell wall biosynthesis